jgi:hypothetical protein
MKITKSQLKEIIKEEIQRLNESSYEYGFDLTDISSNDWKKLLKMFSIPTTPKLDKNTWVWQSKKHNVFIVTSNDPLTGKYAARGGRDNEPGYAGYIGIEGDKDLVNGIAKFIQKNADYIKGKSVGNRDFI